MRFYILIELKKIQFKIMSNSHIWSVRSVVDEAPVSARYTSFVFPKYVLQRNVIAAWIMFPNVLWGFSVLNKNHKLSLTLHT